MIDTGFNYTHPRYHLYVAFIFKNWTIVFLIANLFTKRILHLPNIWILLIENFTLTFIPCYVWTKSLYLYVSQKSPDYPPLEGFFWLVAGANFSHIF